MNCHRCKELLSEYTDGALDGSQSTNVEDHVNECPSCKRHRDELIALKRLLRSSDTPNVQPEFWINALEKTARASENRQRRRVVRLRFAEAALAAVVLAFAIAHLPSAPIEEQKPSPVQVASFDPSSLVTLHASARATRPLADTGKIRYAMSEGDSRDYANDNAIDSL